MPTRIDSKFRFVLLAATRAEQLMQGAHPKVEMATRKPTKLAMEEVLTDVIAWDYGQPPAPAPVEGDVEGEAVEFA